MFRTPETRAWAPSSVARAGINQESFAAARDMVSIFALMESVRIVWMSCSQEDTSE